MIIATLYTNHSEPEKIGKNKTLLDAVPLKLMEETSLMDPALLLSTTEPATIVQANYLYIAAWQKYYFIRNKTSVRTGLWRIECHIDVLETYKTQILALSAIVSRQKNRWNLYLNDGQFKTYQDPDFMVFNFPHGFQEQTPCYTLAVSGDGSGAITPDDGSGGSDNH